MYGRNSDVSVDEALADTRVVYLAGPRQCGKSTLAQVIAEQRDGAYLTLDDPATFDQARADPTAFVARSDSRLLIVDEAQRLPDLFLAVKRNVDRDGRPGRILLTGSANYLTMPQVSESLAGRVEIVSLGTLSQGEIEGTREGFVDAAFDEALTPALPPSSLRRDDYVRRALAGGYPEALGRTISRRNRWFDSYITTLVQRDVRDLASVEHISQLPTLLRLVAARTANLANVAEISRELRMPVATLNRYLALFETLFLLSPLRAWSANLTSRLVKSPKFFLNDTGLAAYLVEATPDRVGRFPELAGAMLEAFVVGEVRKQITWSDLRPAPMHFRTSTGTEVDLVLEARDGRVVGVEVKAGSRIDRRDTRGLEALRDQLGDRFVRGIVLYTGEEVLPAGPKLTLMPIDSLWRWNAARRTG
ncbi:MAG: ATP-binding protein [bacterium]